MVLEGMDAGDVAWMLASSALVLLMTPGLAFFYGGLVRGNNVLNTMMMSIISMGIVAVPWFLVGFSLAFGVGGSLIGDLSYAGLRGLDAVLWPDTKIPALLFVTYQMTFAVIGAAIISGAVVERMRFGAYAIFILLWSLLVYCPICHWVWGPGGWIDAMGALDFAGGTVVHESTAVSALVLAVLLGPRHNHAELLGSPPHNVPFVILGAALLWFGWTGFNGGSALGADEVASLAVVNTYLAASTSLVMWACMERWINGNASAVGSVTGAVVGLVIITPAAGYVEPWGAVLMGLIGCVLVFGSFRLVSHRVDDSLDAFPCHGVGGFVGTVLTGFFARGDGLLYSGSFRQVGVQCVAAFAAAGYAALMSAGIFLTMSCFMNMRVTEDAELLGLDDSVHGERAYTIRPKTGGAGSGSVAGSASVRSLPRAASEGGALEGGVAAGPTTSGLSATDAKHAGRDGGRDELIQAESKGGGFSHLCPETTCLDV